jgi:3-methyladenine DNA glycosylase/8-oxoguanine DNA glycosylase
MDRRAPWLPGLDAFGTLMFQVAGQQLSVRATRTILSRLEEHFGGHLPSPTELLHADPQVLRASGLSTRKGATLRALAERFVGTTVMERSSSVAIRPPLRSQGSIDGDHPASARRQRGAVSRQPTPRREKN